MIKAAVLPLLIVPLVSGYTGCDKATKPDEEIVGNDRGGIAKDRYNEIHVNFNCKVIDPPPGKREIDWVDFNPQYPDIIKYLRKLDIISIVKLYPKRVYGELDVINRQGKPVRLPEMSQLITIVFNMNKYDRRGVEKIVSELEAMKQVEYVSAFGSIHLD